jgi:hypothetical protein
MSAVDYTILNSIMPRLVPSKKGESILALEIMEGPYRGVTFSYKTFKVMNEVGPDGMVPTKFETDIHEAPVGFRPTEDFDTFCGEVLVAWLHYISVSSFDTILNAETKGIH